MNKVLIKFIELCLVDGVISDKERKVIFRKAKELGVPKDECEIILDGLVLKNSKPVRKSKEITTKKATKKKEEIIDSRQPAKEKKYKNTKEKPQESFEFEDYLLNIFKKESYYDILIKVFILIPVYIFFASWIFYKLLHEKIKLNEYLDFIPLLGLKINLPMALPYDQISGLILIINKAIPFAIILSILFILFYQKFKFSNVFLFSSIVIISLYMISPALSKSNNVSTEKNDKISPLWEDVYEERLGQFLRYNYDLWLDENILREIDEKVKSINSN